MAPDGAVKDGRRPPFCYQTLGALAAIRAQFVGSRRATALAVYLTLTEVANAHGGAAGRNGFEATRKELAESAGVSVPTLDRYAKLLSTAGVLAVERRMIGSVNLTNLWVITDPSAPPSRTELPRVASEDGHIARAGTDAVQEVNQEKELESAAVKRIYEHWRKARGKSRASYEKISPARRQKIQARLKEFSEDELIAAIDAVARDPWPDRAIHDDLTVIFRGREHVERFLDIPSANGKAKANLLPAYDQAKAWVLETGWRYEDSDLLDELGHRFAMEAEQKKRLAELAFTIQERSTTNG
jgi:hypothetical protein